LPAGFKTTLKIWIENIVLEAIAAESILLNTHYMFDMLDDMAELLDVIDKRELVHFCKPML
jgi:hypothetical protein